MSILNKFKKKAGDTDSTAPAVKKTTSTEKISKIKEAPRAKESHTTVSHSGITLRKSSAHNILLRPVVSEKSTHLHSFNQYVFKVNPRASKNQIAQAMFDTYNARPESVHIIRVAGKKITRGKVKGQRAAYKKAVVKMPKGVTLPIYEGV